LRDRNARKQNSSDSPASRGVTAPSQPSRRGILLVILYVTVVLGVDSLAALHYYWPWEWAVFRWSFQDLFALMGLLELGQSIAQTPLGDFDVFKFLFWFLLPMAFCLRSMDWGWVGFQRWKRLDLFLLAGFLVLAMAAILVIPLFPSLRNTYPSLRELSASQKLTIFYGKTLWTLSWFVGWEFLHRYFLLRQVHARWPRFGWLLVPLSETIYHLQKPLPETVGMALFSVVATRWTLWRRNMLLPFLVHLGVELALWLFILFV